MKMYLDFAKTLRYNVLVVKNNVP